MALNKNLHVENLSLELNVYEKLSAETKVSEGMAAQQILPARPHGECSSHNTNVEPDIDYLSLEDDCIAGEDIYEKIPDIHGTYLSWKRSTATEIQIENNDCGIASDKPSGSLHQMPTRRPMERVDTPSGSLHPKRKRLAIILAIIVTLVVGLGLGTTIFFTTSITRAATSTSPITPAPTSMAPATTPSPAVTPAPTSMAPATPSHSAAPESTTTTPTNCSSGNDNIHRITSTQLSELRVDIWDFQGNHRYAKYSSFSVDDESSNYTMNVTGYSGDAGDSLDFHNTKPFSTIDRDNDDDSRNCATSNGGGGWWYDDCDTANLNGRYFLGGVIDEQGLEWNDWPGHHWDYSFMATSMMVRPRTQQRLSTTRGHHHHVYP